MGQAIIQYRTKLPDEIVDRIVKETDNLPLDAATVLFPESLRQEAEQEPLRYGESVEGNMPSRRTSYTSFVRTEDSWIGAFLWYYVMKANRQNFCYDITSYDAEQLQYTVYEEGQFYGWHPDSHLHTQFQSNIIPNTKYSDLGKHIQPQAEFTRKLSFSLQLSHPDEYTGGQLQFLDAGLLKTAPSERGQLIIFDSRVLHRVRKVKSGTRKSLVGWAVGPRWR
tara:strand:- start:97 stop:765 length:669 start_codon:yes stop_codon:yes gene_type:complete